ncbi:MAG TPA: nucleoside 2-deoxyribosyltransferase [Anaerolineales bacterium]|nr:nucleoside 2-deoxyribosyltransferase [Anaerolineales bacterium]HNF94019.1 nucleoside 2-deoxyribosyltransferase [Anaerolineales bacterium]HNM37845.1 nucleoside 2-deoxyribosyltransferase [Anaerolineales bacterium]HNO93954.1 nucleoside 2-deoxyribosyltransferase [Anaerolineales bacterium]
MNIYFACSITGGRELESFYQQFVAALEADGHVIPTSHLAQSEAMEGERMLTPVDVYERDVKWVRECDVLIAEVGVPSHGVGYEIGYALNAGKPVLCLAQNGRRVSKMITGNSALEMKTYSTLEEAITLARNFLSSI